MKKFLLFVTAFMAMTLTSCVQDLDEYQSSKSSPSGGYTLSIPFDDNCELITEDVTDETGTRSYLNDEGTTWDVKWENGDVVRFIVYRNGSYLQSGTGTYTKYADRTTISLDAPKPYRSGDVVYLYYSPSDAAVTSASHLPLTIPTEQYSVTGHDTWFSTETITHTSEVLSTLQLALTTCKLDKTSKSSSTSATPESRTLTFYVSDYNADKTYTYSTNGTTYQPLTVSSSGKATVNVSFSTLSFGSSSSSASTTTTVYIKCNGGSKAASLPVKATGKRTKTSSGWGFWGGSSSSYSYSYTYSIGSLTNGSYEAVTTSSYNTIEQVTNQGEDKPMPVVNSMPMVCSPITLTSTMINGGGFASAISFKITAALIEFRIYSADASVAVGEQIKSVSLVTTDGFGIAGHSTYNGKQNTLTASGFDSDHVTSDVTGCNLSVPYLKDNYVSVYVVASPGTYSASFELTTDQYTYTATVPSNQYKRATRKPWSLNLAGASVTRTPLSSEEEGDITGGGEEGGDEEGDLPGGEEGGDEEGDLPGGEEGGDEEGDLPGGEEGGDEPAVPEVAPWETTYAVFCSDRHGSSSYFPSAFSGMSSTLKSAVPYVCMAGDMVGASGGDHPAYNSSTINNEVKSVFANADVQILWADHDASVTDNAGIVQQNGGYSSGLIYTQTDSQGRVQYYVYGIGFYDMKEASRANTAATAFKNWVSTITDKTIPIITVCHMPIYYQRKDNLGASYWNSALNYAATGSTNGTTVERNVFFIHGHNHTSDNTEYYNPVGSTISVQGTSSSSMANSTIRYTNLTGGYLKTDQAATLFTINEDQIVLTKYTKGTASQLGTVTRVQ